MSSAIPPLIPTVPPPMGSDEENNVDDEFGDFTAASYSYDCLGDSDGSSPAKRSTWIERVDQGIFPNTVSPHKKKVDQAVGVYDDEVYHNCSETLEKEEDANELKHITVEKCENRYRISHMTDDDPEDDDESDLGNCEKSIVEDVEEKKIDFLSVDRGIPGNTVAQDNTSQDSIISSGATDSGLCSASQKSEEEEVAYCEEVGINVDAALDDSSGSDETLVVEKKKVQQERSNEWNDACERTTHENLVDTNSSSSAKETCIFENEWRTRLSEEEDDDFADFSAFRASDKSSESNDIGTSPSFDINHSSVTDKESNERFFEDEGDEQEDDFSDFASAPLPPGDDKSFVTFQSKCDGKHDEIQTVNSDDEFSDFAFAPSNSTKSESAIDSNVSEVLEAEQQSLEHQKTSEDGANEQVEYLEDLELFQQLESGKVDSKIETIANLAFPSAPALDEGEEASNRADLKTNLRAGLVWKKLQDLESTHALSYQWGGSSSNRILLSALSIDSRNILFGPRWNSTSVPRFAANLGFDPLEPVKASSTVTSSTPKLQPGHEDAGNLHRAIQPSRANAAQTSEENVPAAQFDWNSSGLVNPLESTHRSALLDLDFFTTYDNFASSSSSSTAPSDAAWRLASLEKEFLSSPEKKMDPSPSINPLQPPSSQKHQQDSHQQLVERILSSENSQKPGHKNKNSLSSRAKTNRKRVEGLTLCPESLAVIHNLPDLSFINARMLMFPLREPTNGESGPQSCPVALVSMTSSSSPCPE